MKPVSTRRHDRIRRLHSLIWPPSHSGFASDSHFPASERTGSLIAVIGRHAYEAPTWPQRVETATSIFARRVQELYYFCTDNDIEAVFVRMEKQGHVCTSHRIDHGVSRGRY